MCLRQQPIDRFRRGEQLMKAFRTPTNLAIAHGMRGCLIACVVAGCAADDTTAPDPENRETLAARPADPVKAAALLARAKGLVRPGSVVQTESRLGVPTFLWTRDTPAQAAATRTAIAGAADPAVAAARAVLADYAPLYGLTDSDVADAVVANVDQRRTGPVLVKLRAQRGGIEIFGEELNVVMNRNLEGVAISGYLSSAATPAARSGGLDFSLSPAAAAATALGKQASTAGDASQLVTAGTRDGYETFTLSPAAGIALDDALRVKPVYFHLRGGLEAAYYVEVFARTGAPPIDLLAADGSPLATSEAYSYVISAVTGQPLFRKNLIAESAPLANESHALDPSGFTYRVWADPVTGIPSDGPTGNAAHPKLVAAVDGAQATFVAPSDVLLPNFPFSQNDPWLAPGATETNGNNVDAYLNLFSPDGIGNPVTTSPVDPPNGDYRAQITAAGQFLHAQTPDSNGALAEGRQGAIQQLFYNINFLHDWYYDVGFNEAAGNAQTNNFGRGGTGNDSIRAQVQDFSGFNNANMTTGADGVRPRMRMYNFQSPANHLEVQTPVGIAGKYQIGVSMSGTQTYDISTEIIRATFSNTPTSCTVTNAAALAGKIAMFDFDNTDGTGCSFTTRISRLTTGTTASAIMMVYTSGTPTVVASITGFVAANTRPVAIVSWNTAQLIKTELAVPNTVTARLYRAPDRDGSLDNQVIFHEWFHYASNRLIGNGTGLGTNMAAGMGEGWSDFNALLLTVRADDTAVPSNASYEGVYPMASFATSGVPYTGAANHGYYFGIRRYPYSTDMTRNPLTFRHITSGVALPIGPPVGFGADGASNSQVHNTGEVWASMLWECYAGLLRDTLGATPRLTFQQAQDRMKQYLISALKVTPVFPTFTEARDALLAVAQATDMTDYLTFRIAFSKRGAGVNAVSPDRFSTDHSGVVEDFANGPDLSFVSATLDDTPGSCDSDGAMDHGEFGKVTVTLRNTGTVALSATTATVSSSSSDVWYPDGTTVSFPPTSPGASTTASLRVGYLGTVSGIQQVDVQIDYTDAVLTGGPLTETVGFRTNTDEIPAASPTETVEAAAPPWTMGFDATLGNVAPWSRFEVTPLQHLWHVDNADEGSDQYLISPLMTVDAGGSFNVQFDHTWSFEFDAGGNYDGSVVEMSVNGGAFTDIGTSVYNGTILNYTGDVNPLKGRPGFVQASGGVVHTSLTQAVAPGSNVQLRFRMGSDGGGGAPGWDIDDVSFTGVIETPFAIVVPDADPCSAAPTSADVAISVDDNVATVNTGSSLTYTITATNLGGDDIVGATVTDTFPSDLTCTWTCAGSAGGACTASGTGDIADSATLPVGGSAVYLASCTLSASATISSLSNTATVALPAPVSDPVPGNNSSTDTDTVIRLPSHLIGSKTVTGSFVQGGTVTYTIVLANDGGGIQLDNAGDELVDVLPAGLTLIGASATSGTAVATLLTNTVTWNGVIAPGADVTITIVATINAASGTTISNQATFAYDSQGTGTNDATGTTDAFQCVGALAAAGPRTAR
jgi:large repetitive protein